MFTYRSEVTVGQKHAVNRDKGVDCLKKKEKLDENVITGH